MRPDAGQVRQYSVVELALSLAGAGFAVFPLAGKTPPPGFKWKDRASSDPQVIVAEFAGLPASVSNVGIACGPSGLVVIDEDETDAFTKACTDAGRPLPDTYRVQTGSHGRQHWYFTTEDHELGNRVGRFKGRHIDIRGKGGYVVAAGSTHPDTGATYTPMNGSTVAPLPDWIREWLTTEADEAAEGPRRPRFVLPDRIRGGSRHNVVVSYASQLREQGITLDEAMAAVTGAWKRCDQPPKAKWPYPLSEAMETVRDVYRRYRAGPSAGTGHAPHPDDPGPTEPGHSTTTPRLIRRKASMIQPRRVRWLWDEQIPLGALSLLGGAAGMGKSTIAYDLAAAITVGTLPGEFYGRPRTVVAISTEDAWSYTIVPRLIAAGADLERVEQITVDTKGDLLGRVELGRDLRELEAICADPEVAVLLLDPLMSRLSAALDAHKDQQVRQELEPLVAALDRTGVTGLGLIHLTKAAGGTLLSRIMGSAAFGAVARSVLAVIDDPVPDDESGAGVYRLLGVVKSNVAKVGNAHRYQVVGAQVATKDGPTEVGRVLWCGPVPLTLEQAAAGAIDPEQAPAQADAAAWLIDVMTEVGASGIARRDIESRARADRVDIRVLDRVRARVGVTTRRSGFPAVATWFPPS